MQLEESFESVQAISQLCIDICFFWNTLHCIQIETRHNLSLFPPLLEDSGSALTSMLNQAIKIGESYEILCLLHPPFFLPSRKQFWGDFGMRNY